MKNTLETRLGLFFALAFIAAVIIFEMIGGLDLFQGGYHIRAQFNNVHELKTGDPVKMAGVQIGRITSISLTNNKVEVRMKLTKPEMVHTDSKAMVKFVGLLGQNFIAIDFGSPTAPAIAENALLETVEQADLGTIMSKLENVATGVENLTKSFSGDTINNLLGPFTDFLKENNPKLTAILGNMQTVSSQVAKGEGTIGKLIMDDRLYNSALTAVTNLNSLGDDLKLTLADAKQTLTGARTVMDSINAGQGTVGKLVKDETLYNETTTAMTSLREILQKINRGEGSVGKLVNDESLFRDAKMTLQKLDKATEGLEDQGPLSVLGIVMNSLF
jgi:phospholipid/cholesterol/gamma-HCH transport system substrate-binding protein